MALQALIPAEKGLPRAILEVGTVSASGVPGFGANRIPCLTGSYSLGDLGSVSAFAVSEPVLFDPARWSKAGTASAPRWISLVGEQRIIAARMKIVTRDASSIPESWHVVLAFPATVPEADCLAFMTVFLERTAFFFSSAKTGETLSFPAIVDTGAR